jgi:hypothetical protein
VIASGHPTDYEVAFFSVLLNGVCIMHNEDEEVGEFIFERSFTPVEHVCSGGVWGTVVSMSLWISILQT